MSEDKYLEEVNPIVDGENLEDVSVENVLNEFSVHQLRDMYLLKKLTFHVPSRLKKGDQSAEIEFLVGEMAAICRAQGIKSMILEFPQYVMKILTKSIPEEVLKTSPKNHSENNPNSLTVQRKRCYELMIDNTVKKFFDDYVKDRKDLETVIDYFSRTPWSTKERDVLIDQLGEIFDSGCLMSWLSTMPVAYLRSVCKELKIKIPDGQTFSAQILADFIIYGNYYTLEDGPVEKLELSTKAPDQINSKCSRSDLMHYFTVDNLREWLTDHKMISTGKKVKLINRIMEYYDDKDGALERYNPQSRRDKKKELTEQKRQTEIKRKQREEERRQEKEQERDEKRKSKQSQDVDQTNDEDSRESTRRSKKGKQEVEEFDDMDKFEKSLSDSDDDKENVEEEEPKHRRPSMQQKGRHTSNKRNSQRKGVDELTRSMEKTRVDDSQEDN